MINAIPTLSAEHVMPRRPRVVTGNYVYHVLNRASRRDRVFETEQDYLSFLKGCNKLAQKRIVACCPFA